MIVHLDPRLLRRVEDNNVCCNLLDRKTYRLAYGEVAGTCSASGGLDAGCIPGAKPPTSIPKLAPLECPGGACTPVGGGCTIRDRRLRPLRRRVEACIGGQWVRFDCAALSLGPCQTQSLAVGFGRCTRSAL